MTRSSFLKSLVAFVAAGPTIASSLEFKTGLPKTKTKLASYFKLTPELFEDKEILKCVINECAIKAGIDLEKPFDYEVGYENEDFTKNLLTCVITQYK